MAWFDTGTPASLQSAGNFVAMIQESHGCYISCIEEIAWRHKFITDEQFIRIGKELENSDYGKYMLNLAEAEI